MNGLRTFFADRVWHGRFPILDNSCIAEATFRLRLPARDIAHAIVPGQFVMLRLAGFNDPLLGRALALFDAPRSSLAPPEVLEVVYLVLGRLTRRLAEMKPGQSVEVWGPLGNGFSTQPAEHLVMVAGGVGITPFLALAKERLGHSPYGLPGRRVGPARRVTLCYGARSAAYLAALPEFRAAGVEIRVSTDDGSAGHHGMVTDVLSQVLRDGTGGVRIACCGPEPMMAAVARMARDSDVPCEVSLETPMACGLGICFSCVARIGTDKNWDYHRTCVEGPVFDGREVLF